MADPEGISKRVEFELGQLQGMSDGLESALDHLDGARGWFGDRRAIDDAAEEIAKVLGVLAAHIEYVRLLGRQDPSEALQEKIEIASASRRQFLVGIAAGIGSTFAVRGIDGAAEALLDVMSAAEKAGPDQTVELRPAQRGRIARELAVDGGPSADSAESELDDGHSMRLDDPTTARLDEGQLG